MEVGGVVTILGSGAKLMRSFIGPCLLCFVFVVRALYGLRTWLSELVLSQPVDIALGLEWGTRRSHMIVSDDDGGPQR